VLIRRPTRGASELARHRAAAAGAERDAVGSPASVGAEPVESWTRAVTGGCPTLQQAAQQADPSVDCRGSEDLELPSWHFYFILFGKATLGRPPLFRQIFYHLLYIFDRKFLSLYLSPARYLIIVFNSSEINLF